MHKTEKPLQANAKKDYSRLLHAFSPKVGAWLTVLYLLGMATLVAIRWEDFCAMKLNEIGDFLAGSFGPVAFLWLVLGYLQQGRELRLNSEALNLQAEELANSVAQQKEIAEATKTQVNQLLENHRANLKINFTLGINRGDYLNAAPVEIEIKNFGYRCMDIDIFISKASQFSSNPVYEQLNFNIPVLDTNDSIVRRFILSTAVDLSKERITISYKDGTGERINKHHIATVANGRLHFGPVGE